MAKLVLGLSSAAVDKLTSAGVLLSGAAADDMDVDVFVLVNAGHGFLKNKAGNLQGMGDTVQSQEAFQAALDRLSSPSWLELFEMAKDMTNVKIYICSLAGKIAGAEKEEEFIDMVDEICGIGEYIEAIQEADVNLFI